LGQKSSAFSWNRDYISVASLELKEQKVVIEEQPGKFLPNITENNVSGLMFYQQQCSQRQQFPAIRRRRLPNDGCKTTTMMMMMATPRNEARRNSRDGRERGENEAVVTATTIFRKR